MRACVRVLAGEWLLEKTTRCTDKRGKPILTFRYPAALTLVVLEGAKPVFLGGESRAHSAPFTVRSAPGLLGLLIRGGMVTLIKTVTGSPRSVASTNTASTVQTF